MGAVIGGVIGGIGSLVGGSKSKSAANTASQQDLTGYNFLTGKNGITSTVNNGNAASGAEAQLTGTAPMQPGTSSAFNNYLNSTGYQFQRDQGTSAITGSAAARGILNSGSTARSLTSYGQGLASTGFNNYLGQLNTQTNQGLTASGQIGQAGTTGGGNAGNATQNGGNASANGTTTAAGTLGSTVANNFSTIKNFFGGI